MDKHIWQLAADQAQLRLPGLSATVDLRQPSRGLHDIHPALDTSAEFHLLGVELPARADLHCGALVEAYTRSTDLVAAYREVEGWPVQVDIRWQAVGSAGPSGILAAIDLVVSVRTERLDSRPELFASSLVPAGDVLRLAHPHSSRFEPLESLRSLVLARGAGPSCLLCRPPLGELTYIEMIHPADLDRDELSAAAEAGTPRLLRHRLFPQTLEKGVILRARVRGAIVGRAGDESLAAALYAAFASADPPLGG